MAEIARGMGDATNVRMNVIRTIIWAGLQDHHEGATLKDAGIIASEAGVPLVMEKIGRAFQRAFPQEASPKLANPRKAKAA